MCELTRIEMEVLLTPVAVFKRRCNFCDQMGVILIHGMGIYGMFVKIAGCPKIKRVAVRDGDAVCDLVTN